MQILVRVDGPGDVQPFERAMKGSKLRVSNANSVYDKEWVDSLVVGPQPHDAKYLFVEADSEAGITQALDSASRNAKWVNGRPEWTALGRREAPSYPA